MQVSRSRGAPAASPASCITRVVSAMQAMERGCGAITIALRASTLARALKIVVEVGFVTGIEARDHAHRLGDR